jgi:hypothetical protein
LPVTGVQIWTPRLQLPMKESVGAEKAVCAVAEESVENVYRLI